MIYFILLCGGKGVRVQSELPKQYLLVGSKPIFMYSFDVFASIKEEKEMIIVAEPQYFATIKKYTKDNKIKLVKSGSNRQESVYNALKSVRKLSENDIVVIHDSARAYIEQDLVKNLIEEVKNGKDSAIPFKNIKEAVFDFENQKYIDVKNLKIIETPQVFNFKKLKDAYKNKNISLYRDDGSIYFKKYKQLNFVYNEKINTKITTREDLEEAKRNLL